MSNKSLSPPPFHIDEFEYEWKNWLNNVQRKLNKGKFSTLLSMSAALSPSIDPMADGLIGLAPVALADDTKDESRNTTIHIPLNWVEGSDITFHVHFINTTAQTGVKTVITEMTYISVSDGEAADGAGTTTSVTTSLPTDVAANILHEGPTFTIPGSALAKDDKLFIKILRRGSTDTAIGDIGYDGIHIEYIGYINHEEQT